MHDLLLLLLVVLKGLAQVLLSVRQLFVELLHALLHGFLILLALCELDLDVPQALLQLFDFSLSYSKLLNALCVSDYMGRLHHADLGWELALQGCQGKWSRLTAPMF